MRIGIAVGLLAGVTLVLASSSNAATTTPAICGSTDSDGNKVLATYTVVEGQTTDIAIGRATDRRTPEISLMVEGCELDHRGPQNPVLIGGYRHRLTSGSAELTDSQVMLSAKSTSRKRADIVLTIPKRDGIAPGKYLGALEVDDTERYGKTVVVPVSLSFQYPHQFRVLFGLGVPAWIAGIALAFLKTRTAAKRRIRLRPWLRKPGNVISMGAGALAVWAVFKSQYIGDPVWGDSGFVDWMTLLILMGAAAATAVTGGTAAAEAVEAKRATPKRAADDSSPVAQSPTP